MSQNITIPLELSFVFDVSVTPGALPTGPSYSSGGDPGYGPEVEINDLTAIEVETAHWAPNATGGFIRRWQTHRLDLIPEVKEALLKAILAVPFFNLEDSLLENALEEINE
jgi:hypothetical protein